MHAIRIDRSKKLRDEPHCGHNRYHPDIEPLLEVNEGEEVILETRDAVDGQIPPDATVADFSKIELGSLHPLTGPVYVKGVKAGDVLKFDGSGVSEDFMQERDQPQELPSRVP